MKLVHEDGSDHTSCSLDSSEERKNALCKKIGPFNGMTAEYVTLTCIDGMQFDNQYHLDLKTFAFAVKKERREENKLLLQKRLLAKMVTATKLHASFSSRHWKQSRVLLC